MKLITALAIPSEMICKVDACIRDDLLEVQRSWHLH